VAHLLFETPVEQGSKASQKVQKRTFYHAETAWHCRTYRAFSKGSWSWRRAPELAGEGEQAAADASLSRALPPAMATAGVGG